MADRINRPFRHPKVNNLADTASIRPDLDYGPAAEALARASIGPEAQLVTRQWSDFDRADRIGRWDALAQWAVEPNPFYESWYLLPSLRALDPQYRVELLCLEVEGQLAGLMPLRRNSRYYGHLLPNLGNWVHENCFLGLPLVSVGCERLFWRKLLAWADRHARQALFLHFREVPLRGPLYNALNEVMEEQLRPGRVVMREERAMLESPLDPEAYRDSVCSAKKRKSLGRRLRKLQDLGDVRFVWDWDDRELDQWIADFLKLEASGWKGSAGSAIACASATRKLFEQALTGAAQDGKLVRLSLELGGRPIAMLSNFVSKPASFGYKTAFDEDYAAYSPGVLMEYEYLETLSCRGIDWCDSCAAEGHSVMDWLWNARRPVGRLSIAIGGPTRRALFKRILQHEVNRKKAES